jgi:pyruvate/2-oxoglutarate dehydrogenase complex dihydrolipoamide acyltransferase (E2) component
MINIILPELGEGIKKATVSYWYFKVGEKVSEKDDLIELITDKATFNLPSPCSGVVSRIIIPEGETVEIGTVLGVIEEG